MIKQVQSEQPTTRDLSKDTFMRDVKEEIRQVYAGTVQPVFTGSMTIRIHEADGTPYEHIVEIKEGVTKFEIPYNTKYKRLKRNKRQKERAAAATGTDPIAETQEDVLLYCLGDVLQSEDEVQDWRLADWTKEDEERMGQESYEWIRMDADLEWICKLSLVMPGYMYLSQLQQDRDVIAQLEVSRFSVFLMVGITNRDPVPSIHGGAERTSADLDNIRSNVDGSQVFLRNTCSSSSGFGETCQGGNQLVGSVPFGESIPGNVLSSRVTHDPFQ